MAFWTHQDVWDYIKYHALPYSPIYDMGYTSTGCFPCMFGVFFDGTPNRFQRMNETHPKLWDYCMDKLGIREVANFVGFQVDP